MMNKMKKELIVKSNQFLKIVFLFALVFPTTNYADDTEVTTWTEQVLLSTLSVNYTMTASDFALIRPDYSANSWGALRDFLGEAVDRIRSEKLTLHPQPLNRATIVESGVFSGIKYWRVNQSYAIPELNVSIDFSLIVIKASNPPFLIQSVNMLKHTN